MKLIVIDSITFNFRQDFEDMAGRTRLLAEMGQKLAKIAEEHDLAVWCLPTPFIHSCVHNNLLLLSLHSCRFFCMVESPSNRALHPTNPGQSSEISRCNVPLLGLSAA